MIFFSRSFRAADPFKPSRVVYLLPCLQLSGGLVTGIKRIGSDIRRPVRCVFLSFKSTLSLCLLESIVKGFITVLPSSPQRHPLLSRLSIICQGKLSLSRTKESDLIIFPGSQNASLVLRIHYIESSVPGYRTVSFQ